MFKGRKGAALASSIGKRSKTFVPGADLEKPAKTKHDMEREIAIKVQYSGLESFTCQRPPFDRFYNRVSRSINLLLGSLSPFSI